MSTRSSNPARTWRPRTSSPPRPCCWGHFWLVEANRVRGVPLSSLELGTYFGTHFRPGARAQARYARPRGRMRVRRVVPRIGPSDAVRSYPLAGDRSWRSRPMPVKPTAQLPTGTHVAWDAVRDKRGSWAPETRGPRTQLGSTSPDHGSTYVIVQTTGDCLTRTSLVVSELVLLVPTFVAPLTQLMEVA
jgi:hypothetical protein